MQQQEQLLGGPQQPHQPPRRTYSATSQLYAAPPVVLGERSHHGQQPTPWASPNGHPSPQAQPNGNSSHHHVTVHGGSMFYSPSLTQPQQPVVARSSAIPPGSDALITVQPHPLWQDSQPARHSACNGNGYTTATVAVHENPLVPPHGSLYAPFTATGSETATRSESERMLGPNENSSHHRHHHARHHTPANGSVHKLQDANGSVHKLQLQHSRSAAALQSADLLSVGKPPWQQQDAGPRDDAARIGDSCVGEAGLGGSEVQPTHGRVVVLNGLEGDVDGEPEPTGHAQHSVRAWLWDYFGKWRGVPGQGPAPRDSLRHMLWGWLGAWISIAAIALVNEYISPDISLPVLVASFGASAVLLFGVPDGKLSQPRNFMGGHFVSALCGIVARNIFPDNLVWLSSAFGMATALFVQQATLTVHPPGGATALIAASVSNIGPWAGFKFLVTILFGTTIMLVVALLVNNLSANRRYPIFWW